MRDATKEEQDSVNNYIDSISERVYTKEEIRKVAIELMDHQLNYSEDMFHYFSKGIQALVIALEQE